MSEQKSVNSDEYQLIVSDDKVTILLGQELASILAIGIENYIIWNEGRIKPQTMETQNKKGVLAGHAMRIENSDERFVSIDVDMFEEADAIIRAIDFVEGNDYNMVRPLQTELRDKKSLLDSMVEGRQRDGDNNFECVICNAAKTGAKKAKTVVSRKILPVK